ncbi:MAG TPA: hypothetical protein VEQ62_02940, partial [Stellaceae bacterium]|nr:hypothetical protein [Stellaceae bacterium]
GPARQQAVEAELARYAEYCGDMTMRPGALDLQAIPAFAGTGSGHGLVFEHAGERFDPGFGPP